jgi:S1-C subfamily serine protease
MKKFPLWFVIATLLLTTLACSTSFNLGSTTEKATPTPIPAVKVIPATQAAPVIVPTLPLLSGDMGNMENLLVSLYERVNPGVVAIQILSDSGGGLGSGFVYNKEGYIVTNYHVVENATDLEVYFPQGIKVRGKVTATDLDSDLAVVKVDVPADVLIPLTLGDSDSLKVGMPIVAIGNPFGLSSTMTLGIISAKGRTLESVRESPEGGYFTAGDIIQTDAAINPGNSGGPLLNLRGEIIGVNRAIRTTSTSVSGEPTNSGIGFAVSVNIIKRVVPVLIEKGKYDYPYLGISALPEVSLIEQEALGLSSSLGAYVTSVSPGGPADTAGIKAGSRSSKITNLLAGGDLVVAIDGRPINTFGELLSYLMANKNPGDQIMLTVLRGNEKKEVNLTLGKRP